jgi:hypothetical protein
MKRFVLDAVVGSLRWAVAVVIALVALAGSIYFVGHKLDNPDHYQSLPSKGGPGCVYYTGPGLIIGHQAPPCSPPTRAAWQIPLAVLLAAVALGAVLASANELPGRHRSPELPV